MAQNAIVVSTTPPLPGLTLVSAINAALDTLNTSWSGSSAPSSPATGQVWLDTSVAGTITIKRYSGSAWVVQGTVDATNGLLLNPIGGGTASLASGSTTDLGSVAQTAINVTGTTTITSFGTNVPAGQIKVLRFSGALTLTHNATSLILPGGASITTAAGDVAVMQSEGSGNYRCVAFQRAASLPLTESGTQTITNKTINGSNNTLSNIGIAALISGALASGVGATCVPVNIGTITSGTVTPNPQTHGPIPYYTNNGAHTLAPPANACNIQIEITNGASAGAITTSSFTKVDGDTPTTTNGHKFIAFIAKTQNYSYLTWKALQ